MKKRILSITLVVMLVLLLIPAVGFGTGEIETDEHEVMGHIRRESNFDVLGKFGTSWKQTTYDNGGFFTYLKYGADYKLVEYEGENVAFVCENSPLEVSISFEWLNDGQTIQVNYDVENTGSEEITFSIGSSADIQIGSDDAAAITPFADDSGFMMVSDDEDDYLEGLGYAQLNFFGKNTIGVTDIDSYWIGLYNDWSGNADEYTFRNGNEMVGVGDSAMAYSWIDRSIAAAETKRYSVLFGIGGAGSENAASGLFDNLQDEEGTISLQQPDSESEVNSFAEEDFVVKNGEETLILGTHYSLSDLDTNNPKVTFLPAANITSESNISIAVEGINDGLPTEIRINLSSLPVDTYDGTLYFVGGTLRKGPEMNSPEYTQGKGENGTWHIDADGTLCLHGFEYSSTSAGLVIVDDGDIKLEGENEILSTGGGTVALYSAGNVRVFGTGSLRLYGSDTSTSDSAGFAVEELTIGEEASVYAYGGNSQDENGSSYGGQANKITLTESGELYAYAGDALGESVGLKVSDSITVSDNGKVVGEASSSDENQSINSCGIQSLDLTVDGGSVIGKGGTISEPSESYELFTSLSGIASKNISLLAGTIEASVDTSTVADAVISGICTEGATIDGGTMTSETGANGTAILIIGDSSEGLTINAGHLRTLGGERVIARHVGFELVDTGITLGSGVVASISASESDPNPVAYESGDLITSEMKYFEAGEEEEEEEEEPALPKYNKNYVPTLIAYKIIKGADGKWSRDVARTLEPTEQGLSFTANGDYEKFLDVLVDGKIVAKDNYTSESGSTIINLSPAFLVTLTKERHTLRVTYENGFAETYFTLGDFTAEEIAASLASTGGVVDDGIVDDGGVVDDGIVDDGGVVDDGIVDDGGVVDDNVALPSTGDNSSVIGFALMIAAAIAAAFVSRRRCK